MKDNIPKTKTKIIDKNNPWWNSKLQNERKILCKLHKTSLKKPTPRNIERYKEKHNEYKKHCDKAKKISWADYKEKNQLGGSGKHLQENSGRVNSSHIRYTRKT